MLHLVSLVCRMPFEHGRYQTYFESNSKNSQFQLLVVFNLVVFADHFILIANLAFATVSYQLIFLTPIGNSIVAITVLPRDSWNVVPDSKVTQMSNCNLTYVFICFHLILSDHGPS